jgi:hypothetical protein
MVSLLEEENMSFLNTVHVNCPYCGETIELVVDFSAGDEEYVEDCSVCCRPMAVSISEDRSGRRSVYVRAENE